VEAQEFGTGVQNSGFDLCFVGPVLFRSVERKNHVSLGPEFKPCLNIQLLLKPCIKAWFAVFHLAGEPWTNIPLI
jgi:hypothetical protein